MPKGTFPHPKIIDDGISFEDRKSIILDQDWYLSERIVFFGLFRLGHCGDVSIGNLELFEHPDASKCTRHAHANKFRAHLSHRDRLFDQFEPFGCYGDADQWLATILLSALEPRLERVEGQWFDRVQFLFHSCSPE